MRKLIYSINLTADGCCDHTKGNPDEEVHNFYTKLIQESGLLVYGRKTYELMVPFWPDIAKDPSGQSESTAAFAKAFDSVPRVVFSRTLEDTDDKKTKIVRTDLHDEIVKLKQEPGKNMLLGGVDLPSQLITMGLVDEFIFVIHPVLAGKGRRLLDETKLHAQAQLTLIESTALKSGAMVLRYSKQP